jgi:hypothetical protein
MGAERRLAVIVERRTAVRSIIPFAATLFLVSCAWTTGVQQDYPEDKIMQTGSHIPIKDKSTSRTTATVDADAMMRQRTVLGTGASVGAGR